MEKKDGVQDQQVGDQNDQKPDNQDQTVPKSHADKILSEKKALQAQMKELKEKLDGIEREKLEKEGNLQQLVDRLKKDVESRETEAKSLKTKVVQGAIRSALKAEAEKLGVQKFEILEKLVNFEEIEVDTETLGVNETTVKNTLARLKNENPFLFKNKVEKPNDMIPNNKDGKAPTAKNLTDLSEEELKNLLAQAK